ncbi:MULTISPECIES: cysteine desulfurase [Streptomyces]|uniref:cysteine desulfurase n=1 Tax=Streptomyces TaxID=1883 RepID=UPI0004CD4A74|nr:MULTISPECIES: cysteine desulfurase [Streptomyces]KOT63577.1 cysteine desulfurase [Streptomyces rimosus subsp. rimosus]
MTTPEFTGLAAPLSALLGKEAKTGAADAAAAPATGTNTAVRTDTATSTAPAPGTGAAPGAGATVVPAAAMAGLPGMQPVPSAATGASAVPSTSAVPDAGAVPGMSPVPGTSALTDTSAVPGVGTVPGMQAVPGLEAVPSMGTVPGVETAPGVGTVPGTPSSPLQTPSAAVPTTNPTTAIPTPNPTTTQHLPGAQRGAFSPEMARRDFPILHRLVNGRPLVWLDNGATTQKPRQVIEAVAAFYGSANSNIHRGAHTMARDATALYEAGRAAVADFLGAPSPEEIVFVRGTTEAINLVAETWGRANIGPGDDILVPVLEHHSDIVPWQQLAAETHARVVPVPLLPDGQIDQFAYADLLSSRTRLVAVSHASNVLGTVPPVAEMTALAHRYGAKVLVDGAQAVAHFPVDVQAMDADFYAFSGHKLFAPTGIGALYAKPELLASMVPWQGGGNMIESVSFDRTTFAPAPHRFEAGTGHISGVVGLLAALDWLSSFDHEAIAKYEADLLAYARQALAMVPGLEVLGDAPDRIAVLAFTLAGHDPTAVAQSLDLEGIAVRSGHHCAQPALAHYGLDSAVRASLALYNTPEEVDQLVASLLRLQQSP